MISHKHKVIFIHIPKTGGQSIEQMFLDDLGIDWDDRAPLVMRKNDDPQLGPQRLAHLYAREYVSCGHLSQKEFDAYFKFAIVRNPYERMISAYLYRYQHYRWWRTPSCKSFLTQRFDDDFSNTARHMAAQTEYVTDAAGNIIVDKIIPFENLNAEMESITPQIFGTARSVPHRNKTQKKALNPRKEKLRTKMSSLIYDMYKSDFDAFGYPR